MSQNEPSTQYDPKQVEKRIYDLWMKEKVFEPDPNAKQRFTLTMPPPNVTGVLHMGHALMCALEDIIIRRKRMQGFATLWVPGTDHAGIATQMVVERNLMKEEKKSKHDLGREAFLKKVWEWKELSQGTILGQMRLIGCSADWTRLKFTLDDDVSRAVRECFTRLYKEGLVYQDVAMIQWCPKCRTALSDLEVKAKEVRGKIWHIRYPLKGDPKKGITVATTRPETMLGDVAVAVHPEDERYRALVGKMLVLPLVGREIPIIADEYVDKTFGSGAVKITPGHDPNDYLVGKRHKLEVLTILDERAHISDTGGKYKGLAREKAREQILAELSEQGLLEKEQDHVHNVGHCDRCGTVVEPKVSKQWFVNAAELAKDAIRVVETKEIKIVPEEWEKTYFEWMRNIRPWCVSRQLWWGHRIPAWTCEDCKKITVAAETPTRCEHCQGKKLKQEEDVLDTWFSSGLWPISTLGWPDATDDMKRFYPTDVMETGFDILFFWVARMIMMCHKMTGKIPFHTIYLHPMVRDEYGQKMSKTKGNVKDPLEIIERTGADALRFTLAVMAVHGRDVLLSDQRIEGYRNFVNKLWNASRFVLRYFPDIKEEKPDLTDEVNQWIFSRLNETTKEVNAALEQYRFFDAANYLYHFIWNDYCDWFIELIKPAASMESRQKKKDSTAIQVLEAALKLAHPIMPFVTEEIWQTLPLRERKSCLAVASYPEASPQKSFASAKDRVDRMIRVVEALRSKRGENNLAPSDEIGVTIFAAATVVENLKPYGPLIQQLSRASRVEFVEKRPAISGQVVVPLNDVELFVPREDLIDLAEEKVRAAKELEGVRGELQRANDKLANPTFADKAPQEVVAGVRDRKAVLEKTVTTLEQYLKDLDQ